MATIRQSDQGTVEPSSFRDPSGFIFRRNGTLYRQVNRSYKEYFDSLMESGLYENLIQADLLIPHREVAPDLRCTDQAYKIIEPEPIRFISYPYEWSFSQLKDAALATIRIQKEALNRNLSLKDCSAYNIQFRDGKPAFIDTLSFEPYREGRPWVAYRQFCQHFLAPLALMSYVDVRLNQLSRIYLDGLPLDLASALLPARTHLRMGLLSHIHLHAKAQIRYADKTLDTSGRKISRVGMLGLVDNLEVTVRKLEWRPAGTEWGEYYDDTNYSASATEDKERIVAAFLERAGPALVWDVGANTGLFSRVASDRKIPTIAFDIDPAAVEKNYRETVAKGETYILPLLLDLTNPSPAIGWANVERMAFLQRGPADAVMALALIHHLAISNNVPLGRIAEMFAKMGEHLIVEFVPKSDSQVRRLLTTREDVFPDYRQEVFEKEFARYFEIEESVPLQDTDRTLYLMRQLNP